jgi:hypothetical protein
VKYFTLAEAEALIPELERIFEAVAELAAQAELKAEALRRRGENAAGADEAAAAIERSQLQFLSRGINDWMRKIVDLGAVPKGVEPALVDFPSKLNGDDVYLCWRLGEKKIAFFHGFNEGFAARRPLPKRRAA